jgi:hypothetical protein
MPSSVGLELRRGNSSCRPCERELSSPEPPYEFGIVTLIRFENLLSFPFLFVAVVM